MVPEASSTAEIVWSLLEPLGVTLTRDIAEALYVGLVTDTGKFMYENTGPQAHRMAAALLEAGVDAQSIYRELYEGVPEAKLELLARGLGPYYYLPKIENHLEARLWEDVFTYAEGHVGVPAGSIRASNRNGPV